MLMTGREYLQSIRDGRVIYIGKERVKDQTTHPAFADGARTYAALFDMKSDAALRDIMTFEEGGERYSMYYLQPRKSKGLTSRVTIVSGCTHGLIPFVKFDESPDEAAATLLEQRRLFYVAITRCSETLVVSSVTRMRRDFAWKIGARVAPGRGADAPTIASQFIDELGPSAPASKRGAAWAQSGYAI